MIDSDGVFPVPDKVQMISHAESPKEKKASVKSFLAVVVNYYRSSIPQLSDLAAPMHDITTKGVNFYWNDDVEARFVKNKEMIAADVLLTHFDGEKVVHVNTDASAMAICGVLLQDGNMICSFHRKLRGAEKK